MGQCGSKPARDDSLRPHSPNVGSAHVPQREPGPGQKTLEQTEIEHGGGGGGEPRAPEHGMDAEMRARADGWAVVNDPLSNVTIDITKQCVNVSLSCNSGAEVRDRRHAAQSGAGRRPAASHACAWQQLGSVGGPAVCAVAFRPRICALPSRRSLGPPRRAADERQ